jgi:hypothetical protein
LKELRRQYEVLWNYMAAKAMKDAGEALGSRSSSRSGCKA